MDKDESKPLSDISKWITEISAIFYDPDGVPSKEQTTFLKNNFDVDDVLSLSNEAYSELFDKLCDIEIDEVAAASDECRPISDFGEMAISLVTQMGYKFCGGIKKYTKLSDDE